ncbi:MAG: hypothetical protein ABW321_01100, partial [Polyangiales bacterium]
VVGAVGAAGSGAAGNGVPFMQPTSAPPASNAGCQVQAVGGARSEHALAFLFVAFVATGAARRSRGRRRTEATPLA